MQGTEEYPTKNCYLFDNKMTHGELYNDFYIYFKHTETSSTQSFSGPIAADFGGNYGFAQFYFGNDRASCQQECRESDQCRAYQYSPTQMGDGDYSDQNCYLFDNKNTDGELVEDFYIYFKQGPCTASFTEAVAADFLGDYGFAQYSFANNRDACARQCFENERCKAYQYSNSQKGTEEFPDQNCYLFDTERTDGPLYGDFYVYFKQDPKASSASAQKRLRSDGGFTQLISMPIAMDTQVRASDATSESVSSKIALFIFLYQVTSAYPYYA